MGTPLLCSMEEIDLTAEIIAAIKADADLGTADGGLVAEVNKIQRSATAKAAGAAATETWTVVTDTTGQLVFTKVVS